MKHILVGILAGVFLLITVIGVYALYLIFLTAPLALGIGAVVFILGATVATIDWYSEKRSKEVPSGHDEEPPLQG